MTVLPSLLARYQKASLEMNQEADALMRFWSEHGVDHRWGGFHGQLDRSGAPVAPSDKGLIQQSRHLWTLAMWTRRRGATQPRTELAHRTFEFIQRHFRDRDGEYFFQVSQDGQVIHPKKPLYAQAFVIFSLAEYALAFDAPEARDAALACFRSIDGRAHDPAELGYDQTGDPGFLVAGAAKGTNTHIHILEALTPLLRLTQDPIVLARLAELVTVISEKILQPAGYAHQAFHKTWQPFGAPAVSYGHDLETSWLVLDALSALRETGQPHPDADRVQDRMVRLAKNAAEWGFDEALGGYFEEGPPAAEPDRLEKIWWVQAEALPGLWQLHARTGAERPFRQLERTWDWIQRFQKDPDYPGWYWGIQPSGEVGPRGTHKGELWKTAYHDVRALVYTSDWIAAARESALAART